MEHRSDWIDPAAALSIAWRGADEFCQTIRFAAINEQKGRRFEKPLMVERLDIPHEAYYLVPLIFENKAGVVFRIDAKNGSILGMITFKKPSDSSYLSHDAVHDLVRRKFPDKTIGSSRLVWQPCQESTTPFRPFYEIAIDGIIVYIDMEGSILRKLTPLGFGGLSHD
jgi:hypothetical protein